MINQGVWRAKPNHRIIILVEGLVNVVIASSDFTISGQVSGINGTYDYTQSYIDDLENIPLVSENLEKS